MPIKSVVPAGSGKPLAPYSPGAMAHGVLYVSGTLPFDKDNNVVHIGDAAAQARHVLETIKGVVEAAGGSVLEGMCFYQSYAREMAEANNWKKLATNSAKLTNIIGGYGYKPALLSMEACVEAACAGGRIAQ